LFARLVAGFATPLVVSLPLAPVYPKMGEGDAGKCAAELWWIPFLFSPCLVFLHIRRVFLGGGSGRGLVGCLSFALVIELIMSSGALFAYTGFGDGGG